MKNHYGHEAGQWSVGCVGCNPINPSPSLADAWDAAIEAAANGLETAVEYQWNGNPRRPNNYRSAARNVRTTPNPYRKAYGDADAVG